MKKRFICYYVMQIAFLSVTFSQPCDGILNHGVYDYRNTNSSEELASSFVNWYKNQNIRTIEDAKSASADASIPLEEIIIGVGFDYDQKGIQSFQSYIENYSENKYSENQKFEQAIKSINPDVVKAWEACTNRKGLHIWVEHSNNPNIFTLCANYIDDGPGGASAKIKSIQFEGGNITTTGDVFYSNNKVNPSNLLYNSIQSQSFTRENDEPFTLVVNTTRGDAFRYPFTKIEKVKTIFPILDPKCNTSENPGYPFLMLENGSGGNESVQFLGMMKFKIENNKVWCYYDAKMSGANGNKSQASSGWCAVYTPRNGEQILGFSEANCDNNTAVRFDFAPVVDGYTPIGTEIKQIAALGRTVGTFYIKHTGNTRGVLYGSFYNNEVNKFLGIRIRQ